MLIRMARQPAGGFALQALNRHNEALASFSRALELRKDFAEAHFNHARSAYGRPPWLGEYPLRGLLLHAEQGLGDCPWIRNVVWSSAGQGSCTPTPHWLPARYLAACEGGKTSDCPKIKNSNAPIS